MKVLNCTPEMVKVAINAQKNFKPMHWEYNARLTGVGFDENGNKCIEFVEYQGEDGGTESSYSGDIKSYANRVVNF